MEDTKIIKVAIVCYPDENNNALYQTLGVWDDEEVANKWYEDSVPEELKGYVAFEEMPLNFYDGFLLNLAANRIREFNKNNE